jgi:20S proteasome subunit beta 3
MVPLLVLDLRAVWLITVLRQGPEDLFETVSQALLNAVDRDALSGWGAHVYIIEKDKVTKRLLKGRQD